MKRTIVLPSSYIGEGEIKKQSFSMYEINSKIYSGVLGLLEIDQNKKFNVIPLRGKYYPKVGDKIIGIINRYQITSWSVDINSFTEGILPISNIKKTTKYTFDLSRILEIGDTIFAEIVNFDRVTPPILAMNKKGLGKIETGYIFTITPVKVPRLIGKRRSMISMLEEKLNAEIIVGSNGRVVIKTDDFKVVSIFKEVLQKIELESYTSGLTDRIKNLIEEKLK